MSNTPRSDIDRRVSFAPSLDDIPTVLSPKSDNIPDDDSRSFQSAPLSPKSASSITSSTSPCISPVASSMPQVKREVEMAIQSMPTEEVAAAPRGCHRAPWSMMQNMNFIDTLCTAPKNVPEDKENQTVFLLSPQGSSQMQSSIEENTSQASIIDCGSSSPTKGEEGEIDDEAFLPEKTNESAFLPPDDDAFLPPEADDEDEAFLPGKDEAFIPVDDGNEFLPKDDDFLPTDDDRAAKTDSNEMAVSEEKQLGGSTPQQADAAIASALQYELETKGSTESEILSLRSSSEDPEEKGKKESTTVTDYSTEGSAAIGYSRIDIEKLRNQLQKTPRQEKKAGLDNTAQEYQEAFPQDSMQENKSSNSLRFEQENAVDSVSMEEVCELKILETLVKELTRERDYLKQSLKETEQKSTSNVTDLQSSLEMLGAEYTLVKDQVIELKASLREAEASANKREEEYKNAKDESKTKIEELRDKLSFFETLQAENSNMRLLNTAQAEEISSKDLKIEELQQAFKKQEALLEEQKTTLRSELESVRLENEHFQTKIQEQSQQLIFKEQTIGTIKEEIRRLEDTIEQQKETATAADNTLRVQNEELRSSIKEKEQQFEAAVEDRSKLRTTQQTLRVEIDDMKGIIKEQLKTISKKDQELKEKDEQLKVKIQQWEVVLEDQSKLRTTQQTLQAEINDMKGIIKEQLETISKKDQELKEKDEQLKVKIQEEEDQRNTIDSLMHRAEKFKSIFEKQQQSLYDTDRELVETSEKLEAAQEGKTKATMEVMSLKSAIQKQQESIKQKDNEILELNSKLESAITEQAELADLISSQKLEEENLMELQDETKQMNAAIQKLQEKSNEKKEELLSNVQKLEIALQEQTEMARNIDSLCTEKEELCKSIEKLHETLAAREQEMQETETQRQARSNEVIERLNTENAKLRASAGSYHESLQAKDAELKEALQGIEEANQEQTRLNDIIEALRTENGRMKSTIEEHQESIDKREQEIKEEVEELEAAFKEQQELNTIIETLRVENGDLKSTIEEQMEELKQKGEELILKVEDLNLALEEQRKLRTSVEKLHDTLSEKDKELQEVLNKLGAAINEQHQLKSNLDALRSETNDLQQTIKKQQGQLKKKDQEILQSLDKVNAAMKEQEEFRRSMDAIKLENDKLKAMVEELKEKPGTDDQDSAQRKDDANEPDSAKTSDTLHTNCSGCCQASYSACDQIADVVFQGEADGDANQIETVLNDFSLQGNLSLQTSESSYVDDSKSADTKEAPKQPLDTKIGIFKVAYRQFELEKERIERDAQAEKARILAQAEEEREKAVAEIRAKLEEEKRVLEEENHNLLAIQGRRVPLSPRKEDKSWIKAEDSDEASRTGKSSVPATKTSVKLRNVQSRIHTGLSRTSQPKPTAKRPPAIKTSRSDDSDSTNSQKKTSLQRAIGGQSKKVVSRLPAYSGSTPTAKRSVPTSVAGKQPSSLKKAILSSPKSKLPAQSNTPKAQIRVKRQSSLRAGISRIPSTSNIPKIGRSYSSSSKIPGRVSKLPQPSGIPKPGSKSKLPTPSSRYQRSQTPNNMPDKSCGIDERREADASGTTHKNLTKGLVGGTSELENQQTPNIAFSTLEENFSSLLRTQESFTPSASTKKTTYSFYSPSIPGDGMAASAHESNASLGIIAKKGPEKNEKKEDVPLPSTQPEAKKTKNAVDDLNRPLSNKTSPNSDQEDTACPPVIDQLSTVTEEGSKLESDPSKDSTTPENNASKDVPELDLLENEISDTDSSSVLDKSKDCSLDDGSSAEAAKLEMPTVSTVGSIEESKESEELEVSASQDEEATPSDDYASDTESHSLPTSSKDEPSENHVTIDPVGEDLEVSLTIGMPETTEESEIIDLTNANDGEDAESISN